MKIRLVRKLADYLDGVDVSQHQEGDVFDLPAHDAELLLAEGWAVVQLRPRRVSHRHSTSSSPLSRAEAADVTRRRTIERLREEVRREMQQRQLDRQDHRRAEDRIREELHDSRAKTIR